MQVKVNFDCIICHTDDIKMLITTFQNKTDQILS